MTSLPVYQQLAGSVFSLLICQKNVGMATAVSHMKFDGDRRTELLLMMRDINRKHSWTDQMGQAQQD